MAFHNFDATELLIFKGNLGSPSNPNLASFPGPAQLSVAISTQKQERARYLFSRDVGIERMVERV